MRTVLSVLLCFFSGHLVGQNDSLEWRIANSTGLKKAAAYYDAMYFSMRNDVKRAQGYVLDSERFALSNPEAGVTAYARLIRGSYYSALGQSDSAIFLLEEAKTRSLNPAIPEILIKTQSALGRAYISDGNPEAALTNLFEALRWLEKYPNLETELKARINIGWAYLELKRYQDCVHYIEASLPLVTPKYRWMLSYFYNNMAVSYGAMGKVDSARAIAKRSIHSAEANQQYNILANAYFILGTSYTSTGHYDEAAKAYLAAKPYREKIGDVLFLVSDLYTISDLYHKMGRFNEGLKAGYEALALAEKNKLTLKYEGVFLGLAKNYEGLGDFKSAAKYYQLLAQAKDSVYQKANATALAEMQTKFETEKKEQKITLLNSENELNQATIERNYVLIGALVLLVMVVSLGFYLLRYRDALKHQAVLQEQKEHLREMQIQAVIDSQEKERKRFASDLHDGMGQLISALQLNINAIRQHKEPTTRDALFENSEQILTDIHDEIRNIAFNLMPPVLIKEGLVSGLNDLLRRINKTGKVRVSLSQHGMPSRLAEIMEISLYRIIQELLGNMLKYSSASLVAIDFTAYDQEVVVTLEDNGMGYNLEKFKASSGNGWRNINSRIHLIKGQIEFDVVENRANNTVIITVPIVLPAVATYA